MKKKIIIFSSALILTAAILLCGIIYLSSYEKETEIDESLLVTSIKSDDIERIDIKNENDEFSLSFYEIEKSGKSQKLLRIDGYKNIPSTESLFESILKNVSKLIASKNFEDASANEGYGFENPYAVVAVSLKDGKSVELTFGAEAPDKSGIYVKTNQNDSVYLVKKAIADYFTHKKQDFFSENLFSYSSAEALELKKMILSGECRKEITIEAYNEESSAHLFYITAPDKGFADDETVAEFLYMMTLSCRADELAVVNATDKDYEKYGLKNPYSVMEFEIGDNSDKISFSKKNKKGEIYASINNIPVIYKLSGDNFACYDYGEDKLESNILFSCSIDYLDTFEFTIGNKVYGFTVDDSKKSVLANGKPADYDEFSDFYAQFLSVRKIEDSDKKANSDSEIKISISFTNNRDAQTVEYCKTGDSYYCFIDGQPVGKVDLSDFLSATDKFLNTL